MRTRAIPSTYELRFRRRATWRRALQVADVAAIERQALEEISEAGRSARNRVATRARARVVERRARIVPFTPLAPLPAAAIASAAA